METIVPYKEEFKKYIPEQYKNSEKLLALVNSCMAQFDDLETAFFEILQSLNLADAIGPALDYLGRNRRRKAQSGRKRHAIPRTDRKRFEPVEPSGAGSVAHGYKVPHGCRFSRPFSRTGPQKCTTFLTVARTRTCRTLRKQHDKRRLACSWNVPLRRRGRRRLHRE